MRIIIKPFVLFFNIGVFLQLQLKSFLFHWITIDMNSKTEAVFILFIQYISDVVVTTTSRGNKGLNLKQQVEVCLLPPQYQ